MGKLSRTKGHSWERQVARAFRRIYPDARRHLENHKADATGIDIMNVGPWRVQCKKFKKYAPITCIEEVQCDREKGHIPVLITAGDGLEPMACLPLTEFLKLVALHDLMG